MFLLHGCKSGRCLIIALFRPALARGVAMKTMPAAADAIAFSVDKKDMGSGYYSQYMGSAAANCLADASLNTVSASTLQDCFDACSYVNECAGVKYTNINGHVHLKLSASVRSGAGGAVQTDIGQGHGQLHGGWLRSRGTGSMPRTTLGVSLALLTSTGVDPGNFGTSCYTCTAPGVASPDRTQCQIAAACPAGQQYNPSSPTDCIACPSRDVQGKQ